MKRSAICERVELIAPLVKRHLPATFVGMLLTCLYTVAVFLTPLASEYLIDEVLGAPTVDLVLQGVAVFATVCLAQPVIGFIKDLVFLSIAESMVFDLRAMLFEKMISLKCAVFESEKAGDHVSRITNDVRIVSSFLTDVLGVLLKDVILVFLVVVGMCLQSIEITLIILIFFFMYYAANYLVSRAFERLSRLSLENYDELCHTISEAWDNFILIRLFGLARRSSERFRHTIADTKNINLRIGKWNAVSGGLSGLIMVLSLAFIYGFGVLCVRDGTMTLGSVIALGLYFQLLSTPAQELNAALIQYKKAKPCLKRLSDYFAKSSDDAWLEHPCARFSESGIPFLAVRNLVFSYGDAESGSSALSDVSMSFSGNGLFAVSGDSGCGKSTLLKVLMGLYVPDAGLAVMGIGGRDGVSPIEFCAYVSQDAALMSGETLLFNLLLGDVSDERRERLAHYFACLHLDETIRNLPDGLETVVPEQGCFSGGERRRLALVRALMTNRPILLLDEITAGLDRANVAAVIDLLQECARTRMIVVATHDAGLRDAACRVVRLTAPHLRAQD